jgi:ankyrin repeat protein
MSLLVDALSMDASLESILALLDCGGFSLDLQQPPLNITPLLLAICQIREDVALELIRRGANVELPMLFGVTPLMGACTQNLRSTASALVCAGADVNRVAAWTPLVYAADEGHLLMVQVSRFKSCVSLEKYHLCRCFVWSPCITVWVQNFV